MTCMCDEWLGPATYACAVIGWGFQLCMFFDWCLIRWTSGCVGCLANLAMEPAILEDIVQKDGVPFMLQLLRGSRGCIEEALCFLFLFVKKSHENQVRIRPLLSPPPSPAFALKP